SSEIDDEIELARLLDGKLIGPHAFENLIHVRSCAVEVGADAGTIAYKTARLHELLLWKERGQPVAHREPSDTRALLKQHRIRDRQQPLRGRSVDRDESMFKLVRGLDENGSYLNSHRRSHGLGLFDRKGGRGIRRIAEHGNVGEAWHGLLEKLKALGSQVRDQQRKTSDIAAGPRKACSEAAAYGIARGP